MFKCLSYFTVHPRFCSITFLELTVALICIILFNTSSSPSVAQVNVFTSETMKRMEQKAGWYNSVKLDLSYRSGNTDLLTLRTRFRTDYLSKSFHTFLFGSLQHGRKDDDLFTSKGIAHARLIRNLTHHVLVESFVQKQFNESILLTDRNLLGGGFRFAFSTPEARINSYFGTGIMWEHESINDSDKGIIVTRIPRSTNYISWKAELDDRISTSATGYYQVSLEDVTDFRILFEGSISFSLSKRLTMPLSANFRFDNSPPTGIRKHDLEIFNGLSYTF